MGEENMKNSMDKTMNELRDRLRRARESLGSVSENLGKHSELQSLRQSPTTEKPAVDNPAPERTIRPVETFGGTLDAELLAGRLRQLSAKLGSIVSGSEEEFLRIGARLHDFRIRARKISEMSEYIALLINDKDIEKTIDELGRVLNTLKAWLSGLPLDDETSKHRLRAEKVIERTESCLGSMTEKHYRSAMLARSFSARSENVTRYIDEVVCSIQYHDITRQRIEHVKSGLDVLTEQVDGPHGKPFTKELAAEYGETCRELAEAMMVTREEFGHATSAITGNLDSVASNAFAISEEICETTKGDNESEKSFLSGMGVWLNALSETIGSFSGRSGAADKEHAEVARMVESINGMVRSMHRVNGNILYHLSLIDESGKNLSEDISREIGMFAVHEKMTTEMEDVTAGLVSVAEQSGADGRRPAVGRLMNPEKPYRAA